VRGINIQTSRTNAFFTAFANVFTTESPALLSMFRQAWKPITATAAVALPAAGYWYYNSDRAQPTFELPVRVRNAEGKAEMISKTLPLASMKSIDARIHEHATSHTQERPGVTWRHTTAALASNDPIEDANSHAIIQRDPSDSAAPGDLLFFTVMDGHGGFHTSQLLSKVLINAVSLQLSSLITHHDIKPTSASVLQGAKNLLWSSGGSPPSLVDGNPEHVALAIQNAFTQLDRELTSAPLRILAENVDDESRKTKTVPDLSSHPLALTTMLPAISGT
jgi:pyruvate dehydrogenase phosphatase